MSIGHGLVQINPKRQLFAAEAEARLLDAKRESDRLHFTPLPSASQRDDQPAKSRPVALLQTQAR